MITRWSESTFVNGKPLVRILMHDAHLVDLEWTEDEQAKIMPVVERQFTGCFRSVEGS
jgi:hypothetical protein